MRFVIIDVTDIVFIIFSYNDISEKSERERGKIKREETEGISE